MPVISMTREPAEGGGRVLDEVEVSPKLKLIIFPVDGLMLWTGAHLHIKCDSSIILCSSLLAAPPSTPPCSPPSASCPLISLPGHQSV